MAEKPKECGSRSATSLWPFLRCALPVVEAEGHLLIDLISRQLKLRTLSRDSLANHGPFSSRPILYVSAWKPELCGDLRVYHPVSACPMLPRSDLHVHYLVVAREEDSRMLRLVLWSSFWPSLEVLARRGVFRSQLREYTPTHRGRTFHYTFMVLLCVVAWTPQIQSSHTWRHEREAAASF